MNTVTVTINLESGHTATTVLPFDEVEHKDGGTLLDVSTPATEAARAAVKAVKALALSTSSRSIRDAINTVEAATNRLASSPPPTTQTRRELRRGTVVGWVSDGRVRVQPEDLREQSAGMSYVRGYEPAAGDVVTYIAGSGAPLLLGKAAAGRRAS